MKKIISILLVTVIGFFLFTGLYNKDLTLKTADSVERISDKFINKTVNGDHDPVIFGESTNLEDGSANLVTSIVVNYRSFDTLGEVSVLFISAFGVALVLGVGTKKYKFPNSPSFILKAGARLVFGVILMNGVFMFIHGHLTPGGGFPGGSMIAAAILLLYIADDEFRIKVSTLKKIEGLAGILYAGVGLVGLVAATYFLENFFRTGVVGQLFSGGIIPLIYIIIGLKVGAELSGIVENFMSEEVTE